jgi:hypothetical protein
MKHLKNFKIFESVFETPFYIFGSEDSQDYDVLVSVDHIPQNIDEAHNICKYYNDKLKRLGINEVYEPIPFEEI